MKQKAYFTRILLCSLTGLFVAGAIRAARADSDPGLLQADRSFLEALASHDASKLGNLLDNDFTWTDSQGNTLARNDFLHAIPSSVLGDETGADASSRTYGDVSAVTASRGKTHLLRLWVHRPSGWRLLVYHAVRQLEQPSSSSGSGVNSCENPCQAVPFKPANDAERAIIASWQALETGVTAHDSAAWSPHIAEEFVQISSNSDHPIYKKDRMATLDKQKTLGVGSAPSPLVSAKMFDFGESVIMTCLHQPYSGKPIHVTRLWIKRDGHWVMAISYQTAIQAGTAKTS